MKKKIEVCLEFKGDEETLKKIKEDLTRTIETMLLRGEEEVKMRYVEAK